MNTDATHLLCAVLRSEIGRQTLLKLSDGQGIDTDDGKAWLAAQRLLAEQAEKGGAMQLPSSRDTARLEDMSPTGHLRVSMDNCGDVSVEVFNGEDFASVEFCTGAGGGGKSPRVREALIALMVAIEADNRADVCGARRHHRYGDIYT
jgi:hypothetical protein